MRSTTRRKIAGHVLICRPAQTARASSPASKAPRRRRAHGLGARRSAATDSRSTPPFRFPTTPVMMTSFNWWKPSSRARPHAARLCPGVCPRSAGTRHRRMGADRSEPAGVLHRGIRRRKTPEAVPLRDRPTNGFERFCSVCERIRQSTGKLRKVRFLATYLRSPRRRRTPPRRDLADRPAFRPTRKSPSMSAGRSFTAHLAPPAISPWRVAHHLAPPQ